MEVVFLRFVAISITFRGRCTSQSLEPPTPPGWRFNAFALGNAAAINKNCQFKTLILKTTSR